jgi:hypothetical protein
MTTRRDLVRRARLVQAGLDNDVPSPCISVCRMDACNRFCLGCLRTLDEIAAWSRMEDDERRVVWRRIEQRIAEETP